jgi:hypothetical protein
MHLISVSADRHIAEYDLQNSSITGGVKLRSLKRIDQSARPLAATLLPHRFKNGANSTSTTDSNQASDQASGNAEKGSAPGSTPAQQQQPVPPPFLLTTNSEYKIKLYNSSTHLCRKTVLGPTYGGHITELHVVPATMHEITEAALEGAPLEPKYVAYATRNRVVGLMRLPFDGNPHRSMGLIAHPCGVRYMTNTLRSPTKL